MCAGRRDVVKVLWPLCWETDLMCCSCLSSLRLLTPGSFASLWRHLEWRWKKSQSAGRVRMNQWQELCWFNSDQFSTYSVRKKYFFSKTAYQIENHPCCPRVFLCLFKMTNTYDTNIYLQTLLSVCQAWCRVLTHTISLILQQPYEVSTIITLIWKDEKSTAQRA